MKQQKTTATKETIQTAFTRRDFLKISLATTGALTLPLLIGCQPTDIVIPPIKPPSNDNFPQPKTITSVNGVLQTTLLIKFQFPPQMTLGTKLRMYGSPKNGTTADPEDDTQWDWSFPGPTLRVNPGDRIKLTLLNYLPVLPKDEIGVCEPAYYPTPGPTPSTTPAVGTPTLAPTPALNNDQFPDCFSENNVTNMHYHGMHVQQGESGDDVLLAIYPHGQNPQEAKHGEEHGMKVIIGEHKYDFEIPKDHPQGTFWYHPHKHGATDLQVANGMAGAIIVNDSLNNNAVFKDRQPVEKVLVVQQILQDLAFPSGGGPGIRTVNGVTNPVINMQAGEVQRWRLINATGQAASAFQLSLNGDGAPEMFLIAVDGNFLTEAKWDKTTPTKALFLAPGNRADVLVVASKEGQFDMRVKSTTDNQKNRDKYATPTPVPSTANFQNLLTVNVLGEGLTPAMELPAKLPPLPNNLRPFDSHDTEACSRSIIFELLAGSQGGAKQGTAPQWAINGKQFDPERVDQCMLLDTSETWTLINTTTVAHPFHIHLNPFLIEKFTDPTPNDQDNPITTGDNPEGQWQDTIIIPNAKFNKDTGLISEPGVVVIRHRFVDFTGKFVLHCHILGHEDRGMMQLLEVVKNVEDCTSGGNCPTLNLPTTTPSL